MKNSLTFTKQTLHKSQSEITQDVTAIATYYPEMIKVYVPNVPIRRIPADWEFDSGTNYISDKHDEKVSNETALERSIRRSQRRVRDYVLCNQFDIFFTLTIANDRMDSIRSIRKINTHFKNQRDRNGRFDYLLVPEYHKNGALHCHGVARNYTGRMKLSRSSKTNRQIVSHGKPVYEFAEYKLGFTKVQYIGNTTEDQSRVGNYISKYITKDMVSIFGKKRYWASQGLRKPLQEDNPAWFTELVADYVYENDYGKIYTFTNLWAKALPDELHDKTRFDK